MLRLDYNQLDGEVPPAIGKLTELRRMDLDGNNFEGQIPPEFGNLTKLEELWLGGNDMTGPLPPELGNLVELRILHLYDAPFSDTIPDEFGGLTNLRQLWIENTRVEGPIPPALADIPRLQILELGGNRLSGPLPAELGSAYGLAVLDVSRNQITGPIPPEIGRLESLQRLILRDNLIDGPLPAEIGQLDRLQWLSAEGNMLSGPLPPEFSGMVNLVWLHLQDNPDLSGQLSSELTALQRLSEFIAHETGLCVPADPELRTWLNDVVYKWRVPSCAAAGQVGALLIQSTQSIEYPVPLVAGRSALLRVFAVSGRETTETIPPVRATFFVDGAEVHAVDIPAGTSAIPTQIQMGEMELSANVEIPADVIQPGLEMVVEVDPNETVDSSLGVGRRVPAEGRTAVEVRQVPPLHLTLIPFVSTANNNREAVTFVAGATESDPMFFHTQTLLPVGEFKIIKHGTVTIDSNSIFDMLDEVQRIRTVEQGTGHWMGLNAVAAGAGGVAYLGSAGNPVLGKISMSRLSSEIIAHELGHNLNLRHADCGDPAGIDLTFPYANARTGVWGYDPRNGGSLVTPERADFMSYCNPTWVSDYYFTNALRFRLIDDNELAITSDARTLLVSGGASADGALHLDPAFVVETAPVMPGLGGPYTLTGAGEDGSELFSLSFDMQEVLDGDGRSGFTFAVPVQSGWDEELASLVLSGPDGSVEMREGSEPPMAIMRDPETGQVRAIFRNLPPDAMAPGALDPLAPEPGLEIMVSGGLPALEAWRR